QENDQTESVRSGNALDWRKGKRPLRGVSGISSISSAPAGEVGPSRHRLFSGIGRREKKLNFRFDTQPRQQGPKTFTINEARRLLDRFHEIETLVLEGQRFGVEIAEDHRELKEIMAAELAKLEEKMDVDTPVIDETFAEHIRGLEEAI